MSNNTQHLLPQPGRIAGAVSYTPRANDHPHMSQASVSDWLACFVSRLREAGPRVLDLGCGPGSDAAYLAGRGFEVVGLDRRRPGRGVGDPRVSFLRGDVRLPPFRDGSFDTVLASLSLHYLPWHETLAAFRTAADLLRGRGVFLFRVNATDDVEHGAGLGAELEPGFFRMPADYGGWSETKRFFDEQMVRHALPTDLLIESLEHRTIVRGATKQVWECLSIRRA